MLVSYVWNIVRVVGLVVGRFEAFIVRRFHGRIQRSVELSFGCATGRSYSLSP